MVLKKGLATLGRPFLSPSKCPFPVIPAQAGIQYCNMLLEHWTPAFAGVTTLYESSRIREVGSLLPAGNVAPKVAIVVDSLLSTR